jgi:mRNA-degrading endonuclease RelE of RelBE toxin-antitoxin system
MFKVIGTDTYLRELQKWPKQDYDAATKISKKLVGNPYVGKQLSYPFLREKKIGGRRVYYLVYEDLELILLVASSDKKNQQATIDHIRENLKEFREVAEEVSKQVS